MATYHLPMLTNAEWRAIAPFIPRARAGRQPRDDRAILSAICYAQATFCSVESLPQPGYPNPRSIRTRIRRWEAAGVLGRIIEAAEPAIERMQLNYSARLRDLGPSGRDWKFNRERDDPAFRNLPRLTHRMR
jgi:transposase